MPSLAELTEAAVAPDGATAIAMARADDLRKLALGAGVDVVGIAPADRWDAFVPPGSRPHDILPGAKTVVVVGVRGPSAGAWQSPDHRLIEMNGYDFANDRVIHIVADHIKREYGYQAIQAPGLPIGGHQPAFSMMLAAVLAGLGTRSFAANIILNPKYGLLYYSACLTTLDLPVDAMLEQDVCPAPMCVQVYKAGGKTPCQAACPSDEGGCLHGTIGADNRIESTYYDRERCVSRAMNFGINSFQKALEQIANEDDDERRRMMIHSDFFTRSASAIAFYKESVAQCFECMRVCPIGRAERKLK